MSGGWVVDLVPPVGVLAVRQGAVAQLGERRNRTAEVGGSIPLGSTMFRPVFEEVKVCIRRHARCLFCMKS